MNLIAHSVPVATADVQLATLANLVLLLVLACLPATGTAAVGGGGGGGDDAGGTAPAAAAAAALAAAADDNDDDAAAAAAAVLPHIYRAALPPH